MPAVRKARAVAPGAQVGIAAPAGVVDPDQLEAGEQSLRKLGFEPVRRADLTARWGYLAGDDERRAAELSALVKDPNVAAIICARGGYGSSRIVDRLDPALFRRARKPLVGYSDITSLLLWQMGVAGLMGIHGPMLERPSSIAEDAGESLFHALTATDPQAPLLGRSHGGGRAEGKLVGGSLTLVAASLGTAWEIDTQGTILMLEEVSEPPYRIDRLLQQLRSAGKLSHLVGVGFGQLRDCEDDRYPDHGAAEVIRDILDPLGIPLVSDLPFGHGDRNFCWPVGARAVIDGDRGELELLESAVAAH